MFALLLVLTLCLTWAKIPETAAATGQDKVINFPDANLKKALIDNGVDLNDDGQITIGEMESIKPDMHGMGGELELQRYGIQNLEGIQYAANLSTLLLNNNPIKDISPLSEMHNLEWIILDETNISDISDLSGLTKLRILGFQNTGVSDINPVASMRNLTVLYMDRNGIEDLSPLANLSNLSILFASSNNIRDISPLASLSKLSEVDLSNNRIQDISAFSHTGERMQRLALNLNDIQDLSPLAGMKGLRSLEAYDNRISDISVLDHMKNLRYLDLDVNLIEDISPIADLTSLELLYLADNRISKIESIANLTNLESLNLSWNSKISDISPLQHLTKLRSLYLIEMGIDDIRVLESLINLETLNLSNNEIEDVQVLHDMTELRKLYLENNRITDISALSNLEKLIILELRGNPELDPSPIKDLPNLDHINLDSQAEDTLEAGIMNVVDNGAYNTDITLTFEDSVEVKLNGQPIESGYVVREEGSYSLYINEVAGVGKTIHFQIDRTPPTITGVEHGAVYEDAVKINFDEGSATLNNELVDIDIYYVDQFDGSSNYEFTVKEDGIYTLVVTDRAGNQTTVEFSIQTPDVEVRGVTDQGIYYSERTILFTDGTATLNGLPIVNREKVTEPGEYELVVTGDNGGTKTFRFTIIEEGTYDPEWKEEPVDDVPLIGVSSWAEADVDAAQRLSLTEPVDRLNFSSSITREQFSEVTVKLYEVLTGSDTSSMDRSMNPFQDTANPEIVKAYQLGIVTGTASDRFSPQALITREQLATMLKRVLDQANVEIPYGQSRTFDDQAQFSSFAIEAIDYMSSIDVVKGVNDYTFGAKEHASIEQAIVMAKRIYSLAVESGAIPARSELSEWGIGPDDMSFGVGGMFEMYVEEQVLYTGYEEPRNNYALRNTQSFVLPAYSAVYVLAPNNQTPGPDFNSGYLVAANSTGASQVIEANQIEMSLIFSDNWGTIEHPDGTIEVMRSTGPYVRLVVFDGPFDNEKPYGDYVREQRIMDLGDWFKVRHVK